MEFARVTNFTSSRGWPPSDETEYTKIILHSFSNTPRFAVLDFMKRKEIAFALLSLYLGIANLS